MPYPTIGGNRNYTPLWPPYFRAPFPSAAQEAVRERFQLQSLASPTAVIIAGGLGQISYTLEWQDAGAHRFWRIRKANTLAETGADYSDVQFFDAQPDPFVLRYDLYNNIGGFANFFSSTWATALPTAQNPIDVHSLISNFGQTWLQQTLDVIIKTVRMSLATSPGIEKIFTQLASGSPPYTPSAAAPLVLATGLNSNVALAPGYSSFQIVDPGAAFSIDGLGNGTASRMVILTYAGTQTCTFVTDTNSVSTLSNRIQTGLGANITLGGPFRIALLYDGGIGEWAIFATHDALGSFTNRGLNTQLFTASGTWTCPPGITTAYITGCGGGGGGGAGGGSGTLASGGGGGADSIFRQQVTVVPGTVYTITIGPGGAGSSVAGTDGSAGSATSFGALLSLSGGGAGKSTPGSYAGGAAGGPGASAGGGGDITNNIAGQGGGSFIGTTAVWSHNVITAPYGAGGPGATALLGGSNGGSGILWVEW